ncbi:MAG: nicotinate-nucleotide--dimethylbenzimidazole phosphoribosyltransferase [Oscillospiraceae bacterium]|nr:nicotinate-nucleotide--dimethylbenzimidazole phosphoribosyltransferase [Oscillospiraceae bacterium]
MDFHKMNEILPTPSRAVAELARAKWDAIAKPLGSLGLLEDAVVQIAALTGEANVRLRRRAVLVLCADNGVVREGISQTDSAVTMLVAENLTRRQTSVCLMARAANAEVYPVDMGMNTEPAFEGMLSRRVGNGTANFADTENLTPAMTRAQAEQAVVYGIELAQDMKARGVDIAATGEMGIGNTTTASAVFAALTGIPARTVTGRGSGLSDAGLRRKVEVIENAIARHKPDRGDPIDVLAKLGGFDIAGMAGIFIGGARCGLPILADGFISSVAALLAVRLCHRCAPAILASHVSAEPAGRMVLEALGLKPLICAEMRLGEGTGAVAALPLLDLALAVYHGSSSFAEIGMEAYETL